VLSNARDATLYPNPVTNELTIEDEQRIYSNWQIIDPGGRLIASGKTSSRQTEINTARLAPGVYAVVLKGATATKTFRLQKL
jgi:hypothetical protein